LYCKLPQDSPIAVRGVRNNQCMGKPGKRAPTVEICESDQPYMPLAMRQHVLGPYPLDPNLISQGIPADSRVNPDENLYAPLDGTPLPPADPPAPAPESPPAPAVPPDAPPPAAPAAFSGDAVPDGGSVAVAKYDPRTGRYVGTDGLVYHQSNLTAQAGTANWQDMLPH
jgi:phospholipid/cholesterol/gamma-HCH transport system substrate-binding protein